MSLTIEKLDGGYIATHHSSRQIASAEHVANLIVKYWPDVITHIRVALTQTDQEAKP
jgi:hypothetical protein